MPIFKSPQSVSNLGTVSVEEGQLELAPLSPVDAAVWPQSAEFKLYDTIIPAVSKDGIFFIPTMFLSSDDCEMWADTISQFLQTGGPLILATPWLMGSGTMDITGAARTSASHSSGKAIDITPMWSDTEIVDPDGAMPALAWNLASLSALVTITSDSVAWAAEGDHLHISIGGQPQLKQAGYVLCAPTTSTAYPLSHIISEHAELKPLFSKPYAFSIENDSVHYDPIDQFDLFREYLEGGN